MWNYLIESPDQIIQPCRRLKHVKENDLVHGEFGKWLESVEIKWDVANRLMKIVTEFSSDYVTSHNLGLSALYEITQIPEKDREQAHTIPSTGETKTVDEKGFTINARNVKSDGKTWIKQVSAPLKKCILLFH